MTKDKIIEEIEKIRNRLFYRLRNYTTKEIVLKRFFKDIDKLIEKAISSSEQKIKGWEKLFEEEQTGREQAQEEVRKSEQKHKDFIKRLQDKFHKQFLSQTDRDYLDMVLQELQEEIYGK